MARFALLATDPEVAEVGDKTLRAGGSALSAVLSGFFLASGKEASVLFSSVAILVGGVGAGVFAYDGRLRQPGLGAKRPRGFLSEDAIPPAARAAVPGSVAAAALAVAFHPNTTLLPCARVGVQAAKNVGAIGRAQLLEKIASLGATALGEAQIKKSFLSQFGPLQEGLMTSQDLASPKEMNLPARETEAGYGLPWETGAIALPDHLSRAIVAVDARGLFVALSYGTFESGITLSPFQTDLPMVGQPVMRGVSRLAPGSPIPAFHDLLLKKDKSGRLCGVSALAHSAEEALHLRREEDSREVFKDGPEFLSQVEA